MIRPKKAQKPTFASIFRSMTEMPTGVSHDPKTTAHRAVTDSNSRCLAEPSRALPPTPAGNCVTVPAQQHPAGRRCADRQARHLPGRAGRSPSRS
jgi:hypothetical protein